MQALDIDLDSYVKNADWRDDAACRGLDAILFHPERGGDSRSPKSVCDGCSVAEECLAFALVNFEKHGIWGGKSEKERRVMRVVLTEAGLLTPPSWLS